MGELSCSWCLRHSTFFATEMLRSMSRYLVMRLWIGRRVFRAYGRFVVRVSRKRIIKGPCELSELKALEYISKHTSIPVPKVFRTYHVRGSLFIELEFIRGTDLQEAWLGGCLSTQVKEDIVRQLAGLLSNSVV